MPTKINLKLNDLHVNRPKFTFVKLLWANVMCNYDDLIYSLWCEFTEKGKTTFLYKLLRSFVKFPFMNFKKYSVNILLRVELHGTMIVKDSGLRGLENDNFSLNFNYEIPHSALRATFNKKQALLNDFLRVASEKSKLIPGLDQTVIVRFTEIVTEVSYKVVKKV